MKENIVLEAAVAGTTRRGSLYSRLWTMKNKASKSASISLSFLLLAAYASQLSLCFVDDTLTVSARLHTNGQLQSLNRIYALVMQPDCNLVAYRLPDNTVLWSSGSSSKGEQCFALLRPDGNLLVYNDLNLPVWSTNTSRLQDKYRLVMQNDGNLVLYTSSDVAIWDSS